MGLAFGILGPLEVRRDGRVIELPGPKQRVVLAALLLHANEVVSSSRLIDVLWGEHPPATADKALQMHISQLRKQLEPERSGGAAGQVIVTRPAGYAVHLGDEQLDLTRFERAVEEADGAGGARETAEALRAALALWRG